MVVVDGQGIPQGGTIASPSPAEVRLAEATLETIKVPRQGRGPPEAGQSASLATRLMIPTNCEPDWGAKGSASWSRTAETGKQAESSRQKLEKDTNTGGKSNGPLPGWAISADW